jgi:hypothetical protein
LAKEISGGEAIIEVPIEPDSEVSPWRYIHPSPSPIARQTS